MMKHRSRGNKGLPWRQRVSVIAVAAALSAGLTTTAAPNAFAQPGPGQGYGPMVPGWMELLRGESSGSYRDPYAQMLKSCNYEQTQDERVATYAERQGQAMVNAQYGGGRYPGSVGGLSYVAKCFYASANAGGTNPLQKLQIWAYQNLGPVPHI